MALEPLPASVPERTVPDLLQRNVKQNPDNIALIASSSVRGEQRVTYRQLAEESARVAGSLADCGVRKGDRVGILLSNDDGLETHLVYHASHRLGAINVPLNCRYVARELEYTIGFAGIKTLVLGAPFADLVASISDRIPPSSYLEVADRPTFGKRFDAAVERAAVPPSATLDETDEADWIFTSGTTANPKAVALSHANSIACAYGCRQLIGATADTIYQNSAPFYTSTGCHTNLLGCMAAGCTYVVEPAFDAQETMRRIERYRSTCTYIVSGLVQLILDRVDLSTIDLSSLRRFIYGGQGAPKSFYQRMEDVFGQGSRGIELVHVWGLTEGGTNGTFHPPELHAEFARDVGQWGMSVGNRGFNEWVKIRVARDDDSGADPGEVGEICMSGPSCMERYMDNEDATAEALRNGWLHTGDLGVMDERGFLYFVDRKKDIIRRGGLNIASAEIEAVMHEHPAVLEVAAIPMPNPILGEEVKIAVVLRPGRSATAEELISFAGGHLADYKVPRAVDFYDSLPRNAMGRVMKAILKGQGSALSA